MYSGETPAFEYIISKTGTTMIPPPTPKSPASTPAAKPVRRRIRREEMSNVKSNK